MSSMFECYMCMEALGCKGIVSFSPYFSNLMRNVFSESASA